MHLSAAAGEVLKDKHHENNVVAAGGLFLPSNCGDIWSIDPFCN